MLCYDLSERIDVAKSNNNKECMVCHYWFFNHGFKFQNFVCNGCHYLIMLCLNLNNIALKFRLLKTAMLDDCGYV